MDYHFEFVKVISIFWGEGESIAAAIMLMIMNNLDVTVGSIFLRRELRI
jgi:hypothetical protein